MGELTLQEMCKFISKTIKQESGKDVSPKEIFNGDPNGELFHIPILYEYALKVNKV